MGMELLTEISRMIDFLKSKPEECDVLEVIRVLSVAHEVARDGLQRSHQADQYTQLIPQLEQFETLVPQLKESKGNAEALLVNAQADLEAFKELLGELRADLIGKVELIGGYSAEYKDELKRGLEEKGIKELLSSRCKILSDFNGEWRTPSAPERLPAKGEFINHKLYQTGA